MPNLIEELQSEMNRVRELKKEYELLPTDARNLGTAMMTMEIATAEKAIAEGDTILMLKCYESLKGFTG